MNKQDILKTLPKCYRSDKWVNALYDTALLDEVNRLSNINLSNMFMTKLDDYGCSLYERDLDIDTSDNIDVRRQNIISAWRASQRCTLKLLQQIGEQWFDNKLNISYNGDAELVHTAQIGFAKIFGDDYISQFLKAYNVIIPAHFIIKWVYEHNRWINYYRPYSWGVAKETYINWQEPRSKIWRDELKYIDAIYWQYTSTITWDDVLDKAIERSR